jgi:hypothetical protein
MTATALAVAALFIYIIFVLFYASIVFIFELALIFWPLILGAAILQLFLIYINRKKK